MGRKGGTETLSVVLLAFLEERIWKQKDLQRRADVERKTLVTLLTDLQHAGLPLEREEEHPHVYWSVPKTWFPGAVAFQGSDVEELVRLLQRAPKSKRRERLLNLIAQAATGVRSGNSREAVITRALEAEEEEHLAVLQESIERSTAVYVHYYTVSRGELAWRHFTVQRIFVDTGRFIATCHRDSRLKWFRVDGIASVRVDSSEVTRVTPNTEVEKLLAESVDGYHSGAPPLRCVFRVRLPEARWVKPKMPGPFEAEERKDETVFTVVTSGLIPLARFIVGLGAAAKVETEELARLVRELAEGALKVKDMPATQPVKRVGDDNAFAGE